MGIAINKRLRRVEAAASNAAMPYRVVGGTTPDRERRQNAAPASLRDPERAAIDQAIVLLDRMISRQLDEILHHPRYQQLEASWRGLHYLADTEAEYDEDLTVKIRVLNLSWQELAKDITRALEFDQSHVFHCVYSSEFGTPGGEPFGVLLGDYAVSHRRRPGIPVDDTDVLTEMARIATAALCPFISNAGSALFGLDSLRELTRTTDLSALFQQAEYIKWRSLRNDPHTRFLGVTLPHVLMREPYRDDGTRHDGLIYRESFPNGSGDYLWGHACYAFGGVLIRAFANTGWFADIRGGVHAFGEGGVVRNLVYGRFDTDRQGIAARPATEVQLDDYIERELSDFGFIPLCSYHSAEHSVFYSNSSLHEPPQYRTEIATLNARLSAMTQYMLCVSRFGHYIKIMGRDRIGSFINAVDWQRALQDWLNRYTTSNEGASAELKARYPLAESKVEVKDTPGRPGHFSCVIHLKPHFQLDQLVSSIRLVTELAVGPTDRAT
ncbi:MAG: type VI secretion system contractile sheath large subunit [Aquisalimonadaceae bacterium]